MDNSQSRPDFFPTEINRFIQDSRTKGERGSRRFGNPFGSSNADASGEGIPVNPYSLLELVNSSASVDRASLFVSLVLYVGVGVFLTEHHSRDGLSSIVKFFGFQLSSNSGIHVSVILVSLVWLVRCISMSTLLTKLVQFDQAVSQLESKAKNHPLRLELDGANIVQLIAGINMFRIVWFSNVVLVALFNFVIPAGILLVLIRELSISVPMIAGFYSLTALAMPTILAIYLSWNVGRALVEEA